MVAATASLLLIIVAVIIVSGIAATTATNLSDDCVWCIFRNDIRRVDHVELLSGILSCESQDGKLAAWVLTKEFCDVQHLTRNHDPAISLGGVLGHLFHGHAATAATAFLLFLLCGRSSLVHAIFV